MMINGQHTTVVAIDDAQAGDYMLQAGEWVEIGSVHFMTSSSNVVLRWANGGSMSFPREHRPAVRRIVQMCAACDARPAGHGHFASYCEPCSELPYGVSAPAEQIADSIVSSLDGATLPELDDETIENERAEQARFDAEIELERSERERMISDVRDFHGDAAAQLVVDGWTVDSAISHVSGTCDRELCTGEHPGEAETLARVTGAVSATVVHERRELSGELVVESVESFEREPRVKIMLVSESGEVLDSSDTLTVNEWNIARANPALAHVLLSELRKL